MFKFFSSLIILILLFAACSRCSNEREMHIADQQVLSDQIGQDQSLLDASEIVDSSNDGGVSGSNIPNIRFVQTPDGRMVPEAAFKLKMPRMLNPQVLKNISKQGGNNKQEESIKEVNSK